MKKRIGTRIYDTETAELIHEGSGFQIYRKRTRGRECFEVNRFGIWPICDPDIEALYCKPTEPKTYFVRLDHDSHAKMKGE